MNDLISRQAAIDALDERCESECEYSKKQRSVMCNACYLGSAKEVVENLPTIDPVKNGKWVKNDDRYGWHCSACGKDDVYAFAWDSDTGDIKLQDFYCPNCGAQMEVKNEKKYV